MCIGLHLATVVARHDIDECLINATRDCEPIKSLSDLDIERLLSVGIELKDGTDLVRRSPLEGIALRAVRPPG